MIIRIDNLEVSYDNEPPALAIDRLEIVSAERLAIIGPSGGGKTTLLRCLKGYLKPTRGKIEVMGCDLYSAHSKQRNLINQQIGFIYQQFYLAPRLSVLQNTLCGRLGVASPWRSLLGLFSAEDRRIAWSALCEVGLEQLAHQQTSKLSGGEQQRVAVARTLAQQPSIILADEPISSLDPLRAEAVLELMTSVQTHHEATLVMSLHQPHLAIRFAQRIIGLCNGRVVFDGRANELKQSSRLESIYHGENIINFDYASALSGTP